MASVNQFCIESSHHSLLKASMTGFSTHCNVSARLGARTCPCFFSQSNRLAFVIVRSAHGARSVIIRTSHNVSGRDVLTQIDCVVCSPGLWTGAVESVSPLIQPAFLSMTSCFTSSCRDLTDSRSSSATFLMLRSCRRLTILLCFGFQALELQPSPV